MNVLRNHKRIVLLLTYFIAITCSSQSLISFVDYNVNMAVSNTFKDHIKRGNMSLELTASALPKARITKTEGSYKLKSHLQSAYDLGVNYLYNINNSMTITTGLHFVLGKRNYFLDVHSQDLSQYVLVEGKELWGTFRIPLLIEKRIDTRKKFKPLLKTGINLRYSALTSDLLVSGSGIFSGSFSGKNNSKPWLTFLVGSGKVFYFKNKNIFSVCLQADISGTYFYKGTYEITIPNKPISRGIYKINGTSLGLSVQYIFTGYNKRMVNSYQKKGF